MPLMPNLNKYAENRLIVYLAISMFTALQNELSRVATGEFPLTNWINPFIFLLNITLPPLIVLRAFMDKSVIDEEKD